MYLYIFDSFLGKKKYKKIIDKIETRITDLEISGRIIRLTILENIEEIVHDAIKKGVDTIVAVGNDKTLCQTASAINNPLAVLGFIPVGEKNDLAQILGIPKEELACEVISARLIETIDLLKINHHLCLSSVKINSHHIILKSDNYKISLSPQINETKILNLDCIFKKASNPHDGLIEIILQKSNSSFLSFLKFSPEKVIDSIFFLKKIRVESLKKRKEIPILIDNWKILKTPLEIEVIPRQLKMIVGRERKF